MRSAPIAATLCFLGLASALSGTPSGATSGVALPAPTVRLGVGNVQVSWTRPSSAPSGAIYTLSRETATATRPQPVAGCSGPDLLQCTVPSMDQNSWQYTVSVASPKTATAAAYQAGPSPLSAAYKVRIILVVAGQSNALGARSLASDPSLASTTATSPADANDTLVYPRLSAHATTDQTLLSGPLWATEQSIGMVGPELGLARKIYVDTKTKVTIVKVACGGTSLVDYTNTPEATAPCFNGPTQYDGTWDPADQNGLYELLTRTVINMMRTDATSTTSPQLDVIGGIYWYQGESDASRNVEQGAYQTVLARLIAKTYADLPISSTRKFIVVKESSKAYLLYRGLQTAGDDAVRAADDAVALGSATTQVVDSLPHANAQQCDTSFVSKSAAPGPTRACNLARFATPHVADDTTTDYLLHLTAPSELTIGGWAAIVSENQI